MEEKSKHRHSKPKRRAPQKAKLVTRRRHTRVVKKTVSVVQQKKRVRVGHPPREMEFSVVTCPSKPPSCSASGCGLRLPICRLRAFPAGPHHLYILAASDHRNGS